MEGRKKPVPGPAWGCCGRVERKQAAPNNVGHSFVAHYAIICRGGIMLGWTEGGRRVLPGPARGRCGKLARERAAQNNVAHTFFTHAKRARLGPWLLQLLARAALQECLHGLCSLGGFPGLVQVEDGLHDKRMSLRGIWFAGWWIS